MSPFLGTAGTICLFPLARCSTRQRAFFAVMEPKERRQDARRSATPCSRISGKRPGYGRRRPREEALKGGWSASVKGSLPVVPTSYRHQQSLERERVWSRSVAETMCDRTDQRFRRARTPIRPDGPCRMDQSMDDNHRGRKCWRLASHTYWALVRLLGLASARSHSIVET